MEKEFKRVKAKVTGKDGNVFATLAICTKALRNAGYSDSAKELTEAVFKCKSYEDAISKMNEYCILH